MTNVNYFPFRLVNVIFISLNISRAPELLKKPINFVIENRHMEYQDKLQVNLRVKTTDTLPVNIEMEIVGFFEYLDDNAKNDSGLVTEFTQKEANILLWPYIQQMVRILTSQMGIDPVILPFQLVIDPSKEAREGCA